MSSELGLDPSDPLNLLLQNGDSSDESLQQESSQDWSKFSTLWTDGSDPTKHYSDMMDFSDLPIDMDFNPLMSIEPSALHYDPLKFNFSYEDQFNALSSELLANQFSFAYQAAVSGSDFSGSSSDSSTKERRLSITSSSSSSGASLSPIPESVSSPHTGYSTDTPMKEEPLSDPAAELAQRVRQSAGVMLAVPMNAQLQGMGIHVPGNPLQAKLPIPRLPRHNSVSTPKPSSASTSSSAASTPPPSTPPANPFKLAVNTNTGLITNDTVLTPTSLGPTTGQPRPKTSHTTIERRYRTNLNARIQSLRMAVPALRVLEDREGGNGKKIKKNVKGSVIIKGSGNSSIEAEDGSADVIDERGFVDGVKVARKCSKANVLGKAVEYIRVLKKREQRLKAEQAGLKTLISGLVGGPALVREWEKEWRANFGGEEKDEVEGDDDDADDDDSDEEDGDDGDEEGGRKRKRSKIASAFAPKKAVADKEKKKPAAPVVLVSNEAGGAGVPEKRKRGRPRKVLPPPVTLAPVALSPSDGSVQDGPMSASTPFTATQGPWPQQQQQTQPHQYLLAVFALFSFFNSPLTSSSVLQTSRHHTGAVLSSAQPPLAYAPEIIAQFTAPEVTIPGWPWKDYIQMFHLVVSILVLASFAGNWLGVDFNLGLGKAMARTRAMSVSVLRPASATANEKTRKSSFGSWSDLAQDSVLEGNASTLSFYERIQLYRSASTKKNASVSDLTNMAIVFQATTGAFRGLAHMKARLIWASARLQSEKAPTKIGEQLVFSTLNIEDAASYLSRATFKDRSDGERAYTPIEVLGCLVVKERVKKHIGSLFVDAVAEETEISIRRTDEQEWRKTIDAARELGGDVEELGKMLERAWKADTAIEDADLALDATTEGEPGLDTDIRALLAALVLYRRLFAEARDGSLSSSTLLSPPPTPTAKTSIRRGQMLQALRTVLGNRVFEDDELVEAIKVQEEDALHMGLEDARDRVVDMIFDSERRLRANSP